MCDPLMAILLTIFLCVLTVTAGLTISSIKGDPRVKNYRVCVGQGSMAARAANAVPCARAIHGEPNAR